MTLDGLGLGVALANVAVYRVWPEVVGEEVSRRSQPGLLRNGRLQVIVADAVWLQQLTMLKPAILASLESQLGSGMVRDIFFTLGVPSVPAARRKSPSRGRSDRLSPEMQGHLQEILRPVQDQECREIIGRILTNAWESD
jgi:predicted nucleic acid-binding Zn ribbon protein